MPSEMLYWAVEGLEPCSSVPGIISYLYLLCGSAEGRDCNLYRCIFKLISFRFRQLMLPFRLLALYLYLLVHLLHDIVLSSFLPWFAWPVLVASVQVTQQSIPVTACE